jgi:spore germination protein GerM
MRSRTVLLAALVALTLAVTGCGTESGDTTTTTGAVTSTTSTSVTSTTMPATTTEPPSTTTTTTASPKLGFAVYFLLEELEGDAGGPFLVPVYRELSTGTDAAVAALEALFAGPAPDEESGIPSISSAIPEGTSVIGVEIEGGLARVDLSSEFDDGGGSASMFARLAQVVYTVTRIDGIAQVEFLIEGEPVNAFSSEGIMLDGPQERADYYDQLPPIFVDSPSWGEPVTSPVTTRGLSNVFEAVSQVMLTDDDGLSLFEDSVMATCGTGCWGEWEVEIPYTVDREQFGALIVWEISAKDGSRINVREYPVQLR